MRIEKLSLRLALTLSVVCFAAGVHGAGFTGTWSSNFGELRLHQTDGVIIGDYADVGILFGELVGENCASGVFTNGGRFGEFSFRIVEKGEILGRYRWSDAAPGNAWNAQQTSASIPVNFTNFTRTGGSTVHIENDDQAFNGAYSSSHGALNLRGSDLFLYGDYADRGVIAARWNGFKFEGIFTNRNLGGAQVGWLEWSADVLAREIAGGSYEIYDGAGGDWQVSGFQPGDEVFNNVTVSGACAQMWPF